MANLFNSVKGLKPRRNAFSSHSYRNDYTCNLGQVVPIYVQHTVPGTTIKVNASALIRFQALIAPIMDNIDYYCHFWQIPYRLLEDGRFTKFVGGEMDEADYNPAYITGRSLYNYIYAHVPTDLERKQYIGNGSLLDMLGYDATFFNASQEAKVNIRPIQAYFFMLLHWYVNEHVMPWSTFEEDVQALLDAEGDATQVLGSLLVNLVLHHGRFFNHGWQKDYFTSAMPNVQEGEPVELPLGGSAPVTIPSGQYVHLFESNGLEFKAEGSAVVGSEAVYSVGSSSGAVSRLQLDDTSRTIDGVSGYLQPGFSMSEGNVLQGTTDLSEATAITINELRVANALQVFKERIMRFGHRSQEYYKGFFNVTPEDLRLQLPKYLGGGRMPINIADIEQTSQTATTPQGNLAGKGTGLAGGFAGFTTYTSEESIILGVAWLMPKVTYSNSMSRFLLKLNDRYDYFNPSFEHLGEQEIKQIEVYAGGDESVDFGYTPRFAEYRFHQNEQHGEFKGTLNYWTLGRVFDSAPALNSDFIYMQPSVLSRIFAVTQDSEGNPVPNVLASVKFSVRLVQPVSRAGTPMLLA